MFVIIEHNSFHPPDAGSKSDEQFPWCLSELVHLVIHTRLSAKLSSAVPLWNNTVRRVVVVEKRRPTFLLITTHRDSKIYKTTTTK